MQHDGAGTLQVYISQLPDGSSVDISSYGLQQQAGAREGESALLRCALPVLLGTRPKLGRRALKAVLSAAAPPPPLRLPAEHHQPTATTSFTLTKTTSGNTKTTTTKSQSSTALLQPGNPSTASPTIRQHAAPTAKPRISRPEPSPPPVTASHPGPVHTPRPSSPPARLPTRRPIHCRRHPILLPQQHNLLPSPGGH